MSTAKRAESLPLRNSDELDRSEGPNVRKVLHIPNYPDCYHPCYWAHLFQLKMWPHVQETQTSTEVNILNKCGVMPTQIIYCF